MNFRQLLRVFVLHQQTVLLPTVEDQLNAVLFQVPLQLRPRKMAGDDVELKGVGELTVVLLLHCFYSIILFYNNEGKLPL